MKLFDKVKNFFFEEEEYDEIEEENIRKKEIPKKKTIIKEEPKQEMHKEVTERELFKAERTFNFPMDMDDDFVPAINNEEETVQIKEEPKREVKPRRKTYTPPVIKEVKTEEVKKFRPTPIISPIYGIIEGEYVKPVDKKENLSQTKEFSITKRVNFDEVRQKAYGKVKNEYEDNSDEESKSIFFNLNEEEKSYVPDNLDDEEDEIKITYNDVDYESDKNEDEEDIEVPKIKRLRSKKQSEEVKENEEDAILSETKEQDLFNLIDNMYNSEEDEEDDE